MICGTPAAGVVVTVVADNDDGGITDGGIVICGVWGTAAVAAAGIVGGGTAAVAAAVCPGIVICGGDDTPCVFIPGIVICGTPAALDPAALDPAALDPGGGAAPDGATDGGDDIVDGNVDGIVLRNGLCAAIGFTVTIGLVAVDGDAVAFWPGIDIDIFSC